MSADVSTLYAISDFGVFSNELEQIHNKVHFWCDGSMGIPPTAAFDPLFLPTSLRSGMETSLSFSL